MLGFNPAAPSNTPDICTYAENWIPFDAGMESAPSAQDIGHSAFAAAATGAFTGTKLDGTNRVFVGTDTKLYELAAPIADVSQSASAYVSGSLWSFCQFGDATIASNFGNPIQASSSSSFAAIVGAPKAKIVESVVTGGGGFVFAFNTNDTTYGVSPDRWWCSAINNHLDWTPATATQCATGRLLGSGGSIKAAKSFGADSIVAYKESVMFHGRYVGDATVWAWAEIPEVGAAGMRSVCDIGYAHFIVGTTGFWIYDGARPVRIGTEVRQWFLDNVDYTYISKTEAVFDQTNNRVYVFFRGQGASGLNKALVWHITTQQWGVASYSIETSLMYVPAGITFDGVGGTFDANTDTFDGSAASRRLVAVVGTDHKIKTLTGSSLAAKFQTNDKGDVNRASRLSECWVTYATRPQTALVQAYSSTMLGGTELTGPNSVAFDEPGSNATPGRFTLRQNARWHRLEYAFEGACRITAEGAKLTPAGGR